MQDSNKSLDDYFPECKGKNNNKLTQNVYLWVCNINPDIPCSKRYVIDNPKYKDKFFCSYISNNQHSFNQ